MLPLLHTFAVCLAVPAFGGASRAADEPANHINACPPCLLLAQEEFQQATP